MVAVGNWMNLGPLCRLYFLKHFFSELDPLVRFYGYKEVGCLAVYFSFVFKQSCKLFADVVRTVDTKTTQVEQTLKLALRFQTLNVLLSQKVDLDVQVSESGEQFSVSLLLSAFTFVTFLN